MRIIEAEATDLKQILELQYLAYQSEAKLNNNYSIPPLLQTLEDIEKEYQEGIILKAIDEENTIIGSVRGYIRNNTLYIGKLIVEPKHQGKGIGTSLLESIELHCPNLRYELFTSNKSVKNINLYERLGYVRFKEKNVSNDLTFVYLEKNII
jgi:GNAT superfamily N-acetyltransferase